MTILAEKGYRWKTPVVPFRIRRSFTRPDSALVGRLSAAETTEISGLVGRMYTMAGIKSLYAPALRVVGCVSTVKCPPGDNLAVFQALSLVERGDVLIIDGQGFTDWCLGGFEMLNLARKERGLAGLVVNGAYRDVEQARAEGFPLYGKGTSPFSGPKIGPGEVNVPVCCGGVIVQPGDVVVADAEGLVVIPLDYLDDVVRTFERTQFQADTSEQGLHSEQRLQYMRTFQRNTEQYVAEYFANGLGIYIDD